MARSGREVLSVVHRGVVGRPDRLTVGEPVDYERLLVRIGLVSDRPDRVRVEGVDDPVTAGHVLNCGLRVEKGLKLLLYAGSVADDAGQTPIGVGVLGDLEESLQTALSFAYLARLVGAESIGVRPGHLSRVPLESFR